MRIIVAKMRRIVAAIFLIASLFVFGLGFVHYTFNYWYSINISEWVGFEYPLKYLTIPTAEFLADSMNFDYPGLICFFSMAICAVMGFIVVPKKQIVN